ncbi:uroporphyrin-III C-methyltransferase, partial [Kickxella alabastrina]
RRLAHLGVASQGQDHYNRRQVFSALEDDDHVTVVAPELCAELQCRADSKQIQWPQQIFKDKDLAGADIVLTVINDGDESRRIAAICRGQCIPINAADINDLCDFWFMSTHRDHSVQIAVSTNSKAPRLANRIRRQVASALPRGTGLAVEQIRRLRRRIREVDPSPANGKRQMTWLTQLCNYWPIEQLARLDSDNIDDLLDAYVQQADPKSVKIAHKSAPASPVLGGSNEHGAASGSLVLVGASVGDPDLLTVRTHRELLQADIPVLSIIKREVYTARKFPGAASEAQDDLNRHELEELAKGKRIVRLKQGDPFAYGRGGEEIIFYRSHRYEAQVVPGLSSAINGPGLCGIPVTHRGVTDQVLIVSGVNHDGDLPVVPEYLDTRTPVVLMAVKRLPAIVSLLHVAAYPGSLPVAIVERAGCSDQRTVRATVASIVEVVERVGHNASGLIVIGHSVNVLSDAAIQDRFLDASTLGLHSAE